MNDELVVNMTHEHFDALAQLCTANAVMLSHYVRLGLLVCSPITIGVGPTFRLFVCL